MPLGCGVRARQDLLAGVLAGAMSYRQTDRHTHRRIRLGRMVNEIRTYPYEPPML
jgi:cyanophycinase-like exopeptidase